MVPGLQNLLAFEQSPSCVRADVYAQRHKSLRMLTRRTDATRKVCSGLRQLQVERLPRQVTFQPPENRCVNRALLLGSVIPRLVSSAR